MIKRNRGFTIIELVMVIAVIAILAAVLIPVFSTVIRKAKISKAEQNATNLSLLLATEAAYDGVSYYLADQVIKFADDNGYSLESELKGYAYFYDAATNKVEFMKIDEAVALADEQTFTRTVRNVLGVDSIFYIDSSDNPITSAIAEIEHLAFRYNYDRQAMIDGFDTNIANNALLNSTVKYYLKQFDPRDTVYFSANGAIYDTNNKEKVSYTNAVVCADTVVIPKSSIEIPITITNPIVVPSTVDILEDGSFTNIGATLEIKSQVGYDKSKVSETESLVIKQTVEHESKVVTLNAGEYVLVYGIAKEATDAVGITYRVSAPFNTSAGRYDYLTLGDMSDYDTDNALTAEYIVPSVSLVNNTFVNFGDIKKITIRTTGVNGGTEYVMVAVDSKYNVYKLGGVGVLTSSNLEYDRDPQSQEKIKLTFGSAAASFDNLQGMYADIEYQYGYSDILTANIQMSNSEYVVYNGIAAWSQDKAVYRTGVLSSVNDIVIDLSDKQIQYQGNDKVCNIANVTRVTVYTADGQAVYAKVEEPLTSNDRKITITLDNNKSGDDHATKTITTYAGLSTVLKYGSPLETESDKVVAWNTKADFSGDEYALGDTGDIRAIFNQDVTLYAKVEHFDYYNLNMRMYFLYNGGLAYVSKILSSVQVGDRLTLQDNGTHLIKNGNDYTMYFGTYRSMVKSLNSVGFANIHWIASGNSSFRYTNSGVELFDGMDFDFTMTEELAALADSTNTIYLYCCAYDDVNIYNGDGDLIKTYPKCNLYGYFPEGVEGIENYYKESAHTNSIVTGEITTETAVYYNAYYGE